MVRKNNELPYEQQMMPILKKYDKLIEENEALKEKLKELDEYKKLAKTTGELKSIVNRAEKQKEKIDYAISEITKYLSGLGVDTSRLKTLKTAVDAICKI